jgi:hypothetical protein
LDKISEFVEKEIVDINGGKEGEESEQNKEE